MLLDAGHSGKFARNAEKLGVDLSRVDTAVLSHGHYDHADGWTCFFLKSRISRPGPPAALSPQYHAERYIGLKGELLERFQGRFLLDDGPVDLGDGLWLIPDGVDHEQSLVVDTEQGLAVFNSCSHAGAGHIAKDILARFPGKKIAAYVGGLHLMGATGTDSLGTAPGIVTNLGPLAAGRSWGGGAIHRPLYRRTCLFALLERAGDGRVHALTTGAELEL